MGEVVKYRVSGIPQMLEKDVVRDELERITGLRFTDCYYIQKSKFDDAVDTIAFVKVHENEVDDLRKLENQQILGNSRDCRLKQMEMDNRGGGGGGGGTYGGGGGGGTYGGGGGGSGGGFGARRERVGLGGGAANGMLSPMGGRPELALCIAMQDSSGQKTWSPLSPSITLDDAAISKLTLGGGGDAAAQPTANGFGGGGSGGTFTFGSKSRDEPDSGAKSGGGFGFNRNKTEDTTASATANGWHSTTTETKPAAVDNTWSDATPAPAEPKKEDVPVVTPSVPAASAAGGGVKAHPAQIAQNAWVSGIAAWIGQDTAEVFIQVVVQAEVLAYTEKLKSIPQTKVDLASLQVGQCVSAIFSGDPYRARITKKDGNNKFTVLFIDWGNSEEKTGEDFIQLSGDLATKPEACVCVSTLSTISGSKFTGEALKAYSKALKKVCGDKKVDFKKLTENADGSVGGILISDNDNAIARAVNGSEYDKNVVMNGHIGQVLDKNVFKGGEFLACGIEPVDGGKLIQGYPTAADGLNDKALTYANDNLPQDLAAKSKSIDANQRFVLEQVVVCDGENNMKARGVITKLVGEQQVEVLLLDWGTKKTVDVSSLRVCSRDEQCMQSGRACAPLLVTSGGDNVQKDAPIKVRLANEWKKMPDQTDFITCTI